MNGDIAKKPNPFVWIGIGCTVLFFGVIAFVAFIGVAVIGSMRNSDPYKDSLARARNDPRVIAALGSPMKPGLFITGSINTTNDSGSADLTIPISGPNGKGSIHVKATKTSGKWSYSEMKATVNEKEINLLEGSPGKAPPAW